MSPGDLAKKLRRSRPWVISVENGQIEKIQVREGRGLIAELGLNPNELSEDPTMYGENFLPEASFQARRVGRAWDDLPKPMQECLWAQIQAYLKLAKEEPILAGIMKTPPVDFQPTAVRDKGTAS